jgi:hypothetical protein
MVSRANNRAATFVACIALFVALVGNATTLWVAEHADAALCQDSLDNRSKIRQIIAQSDPDKLEPGDPGYTYYIEHPDEKQALKNRISEQLDVFPPIDCED